jgi:hypothetical protein
VKLLHKLALDLALLNVHLRFLKGLPVNWSWSAMLRNDTHEESLVIVLPKVGPINHQNDFFAFTDHERVPERKENVVKVDAVVAQESIDLVGTTLVMPSIEATALPMAWMVSSPALRIPRREVFSAETRAT